MDSAGLQIRKATRDDLPQVRSCAYAAFSKYLERIGKAPAPMNADFAAQIDQGLIHVALRGRQFLGYTACYREGDHAHLDSIAVMPQHAGKGIGKLLLAHVECAARLAGMRTVELYTNEAMVENVAMYQKLGYQELERKQHEGYRRVFFRKAL